MYNRHLIVKKSQQLLVPKVILNKYHERLKNVYIMSKKMNRKVTNIDEIIPHVGSYG